MNNPGKVGDRRALWLKSLICLSLIFGFGFLPPFGGITPLGMSILGIFIGMLYGWIFIEIIWPSLLGILALMLTGALTPVETLNRSFGDPVVQLSFFIFVFCATIEHYGLSRFVSIWFITRKFISGRPWLFTYMLLGSIFILGGLTSASPATIIGWTILYGICETCGYKKGEAYPTMMIFGIAFAAQLGMSLIPFKQAALTVFGAFENMSGGFAIDYGKYMILALFVCALTLLVFIALGKFVFKPDIKKLLDLDISQICAGESLKLNRMQKIILGFLSLLIVLMLAPGILPDAFVLTRFLRSLGNTGIVILVVTIMMIVRIDNKPVINFKLMTDKGVIWNVVILLAVIQPLTYVMTKPESGITQFLATLMQPLFDLATPSSFTLIIGLISLLLCQIMNNAAAGIALAPVVLSYCQTTGASPALPMIMIVLSIHLAFLTPAASPSAAMMHANDWANEMAIWKTAPLVILASWLIVVAILTSLGALLF